MIKMNSLILLGILAVSAQNYYEGGSLRELIPEPAPRNSQSKMNQSGSSVNWFRTEIGLLVGVDNSILVQWKKSVNGEDILEKYGVSTFDKVTESIWELFVPDGVDLFELSQTLYKDEATVFAHPNMIRERSFR
jgi:hypothetical protein